MNWNPRQLAVEPVLEDVTEQERKHAVMITVVSRSTNNAPNA